MATNLLGKLILLVTGVCMQTAASAAISLPDSGINTPQNTFENAIAEPPVIPHDEPPFERPPTPSLSAWADISSNIAMGVSYTCGKGFNTLYKRESTDTSEQPIPVEPCDKGRLTDINVEPATRYCYRLEAVGDDGTRSNTESCSTTHHARVGFEQPLATPEESSRVLGEFNWLETDPVAEDTGGVVKQPHLYYMNVLVVDDITVPSLQYLGAHMQDTPVFPEELSDWHDGLMLAKENGQVVGRWYFAVVPGAIYNKIREQSINDVLAGDTPLTRAVVFRKIPVQTAIRSGLDEHQLSYQYLGERGFEFNKTDDGQCSLDDGDTCNTPLLGWLTRKVVEIASDIGEDFVDHVRSAIGSYKRAVNGEVSLALQFQLLNTDDAFGSDLPMHSGWRNQALLMGGVKVHVRQGLAAFYGKTDGQGRVTIKVAKHENTKICIEAENKYVKLTEFVGRTIVCLGDVGKLTTDDSRRIDARHRYLNVLAQMTDAAEYMKTVANYQMSKITVLVGDMADTLSVNGRAFTPCMGRTPSLLGVYADVLTAWNPLALTASIATEFVLSVDIVLPNEDELSRGVGTHEYGHAIMCDMLRNESLLAFETVWTDVIVASAFQNTDFPASIIAEAFADYITSQVAGGTNYFPPTDYLTAGSIKYCDAQTDNGPGTCLDENFTQSNMDGLDIYKENAAFNAQIRRMSTILHDAFDGHTETTKPNDGSHWDQPAGSVVIIPAAGAFSNIDDEGIALDGSALVKLFKRWVETGYHTVESGFLGALADTMSDHGYSDNETCYLFALHSDSATCPSYINGSQIAPLVRLPDNQVAEQVPDSRTNGSPVVSDTGSDPNPVIIDNPVPEDSSSASRDASRIDNDGRPTVVNAAVDKETDGSDVTDHPPVDNAGTVKTADGADVCAMVLASGQFMFSCNPAGVFSLPDLPSESDGTVKRQIYAEGFFPSIDTLTGPSNDAVVMTPSGTCPGYNTPIDPNVYPDSAGKWIDISGLVEVGENGDPVCAMVLANGQHMFSCDGSGNYALSIPLDANGQFKLQVYADGFEPTIQTFDEYMTMNNVRMARATECH